jgi:hypothetical protein
MVIMSVCLTEDGGSIPLITANIERVFRCVRGGIEDIPDCESGLCECKSRRAPLNTLSFTVV